MCPALWVIADACKLTTEARTAAHVSSEYDTRIWPMLRVRALARQGLFP